MAAAVEQQDRSDNRVSDTPVTLAPGPVFADIVDKHVTAKGSQALGATVPIGLRKKILLNGIHAAVGHRKDVTHKKAAGHRRGSAVAVRCAGHADRVQGGGGGCRRTATKQVNKRD